jgi:hypothetical protein
VANKILVGKVLICSHSFRTSDPNHYELDEELVPIPRGLPLPKH